MSWTCWRRCARCSPGRAQVASSRCTLREDLSPAQDRGDGRPQLVGEDGQEVVLGPVGRLGLPPGGLLPAQQGLVLLLGQLRWVVSVAMVQMA